MHTRCSFCLLWLNWRLYLHNCQVLSTVVRRAQVLRSIKYCIVVLQQWTQLYRGEPTSHISSCNSWLDYYCTMMNFILLLTALRGWGCRWKWLVTQSLPCSLTCQSVATAPAGALLSSLPSLSYALHTTEAVHGHCQCHGHKMLPKSECVHACM